MPAKETPRPAVTARPHRAAPPRPVPRVAPHALASLQRSAGNAAVTLAVQRLAGTPASPKHDPRFVAVTAKVKQQGGTLKAHPPATAEAKKAQDAAVAPSDEREAKAKANVADTMATAKPAGFDKAAFVAAVKAAIAAQTPKNLDEAEKFATSGKADTVKAQVAGKVTEGKQSSAKDIAEKTAKPPDPSAVPAKPVAPLTPDRPAAPSPIDAGSAMPARAPPAATDLSAPKAETDQKMAEAGVTEDQLAKSNEPELTGALDAKKQGEQHSATAPAGVRAQEAATLTGAKTAAQATGAAGVTAMAGARNSKAGQVSSGKDATKARDEAKRVEFTTHVKGIFDATKTEVTAILTALDGEVATRFDAGERQARADFTADHTARMAKYKAERYAGVEGALRWTADLFTGLPPEANQIYQLSKQLYESRMERVISDVADHIGKRLTDAKNRIAKGQADIKQFVASQPKDLQKIAQEAANGFQAQFAALENDVDEKQKSLVDDLATRYVEARNAVDAEINKLQEENKGWWDKAMEAVGGAIDTILKLKDMLLGVLARAAGAVEKIIKDPIKFLGNFVNAVKAGISGFAANIVEHLKKGLQAWLFGALAEAGVEIPEKFDLKGIVKLILSILGLTWANIRARIVKHIPEKVMSALEKAVDFIQVILNEGVGGLWKWVVAKLSDLKEMVLGKIREFVITKIITAGITWLISMLNPAAAFIKACKMIYDVVMFFVEKAAQIKEFVDSVLDSVESIAGGGVGAVAGLIEKTLAKMVPVLIGFLASLLGLGGISEKIKSILAAIQKPVMSVVDKLIAYAVKVGKKLFAKLMGKDKKKDEAGKQDPERVKALVASDLGAKRLHGDAESQALIKSTFDKYHPMGLKSLELIPPAKDGQPATVLAAASPVRRIQVATDPREVIRLALSLRTRTSTTSIYVSYDAGLQFPSGGRPYTNKGNGEPGHAERWLANDIPNLIDAIDAARRDRRLRSAGARVPVNIDMNRLPCDNCGKDRILAAFAPYSRLVRVTISAPSVWQQKDAPNTDFTSPPGIKRLLDADMEVRPLDVWPVVEQKLRQMGVQEIYHRNQIYTINDFVKTFGGTRAGDLEDVQRVVEKANALRKAETLKKVRVGA